MVPTLVCDVKFDGFHLHSVGANDRHNPRLVCISLVGAYQNNIFNRDPTIQVLIDIPGQGGGVHKHTPQC